MSGFTLLELLIYVAIVAAVMLMISSTFFSLSKGQNQNQARSEVNSNVRFAIEKISQDLFSASGVSTPGSAGATSTSLVMTISGVTTTYCIANSAIFRQTGGAACGASSEPITASTVTATGMLFTRLENTNSVLNKTIVSIQADVTASYNSTAPELQYSQEKKTTVSLP